jgi:HEAT repeat protein
MAVVLILTIGLGDARADPAGSVVGLRKALQEPARDPDQRDRAVRDWLHELHGLTELGQALILREWRDEDVDARVAAVDRRNRGDLQRQFEAEVRAALAQGGPLEQATAVDLLAEMGVQARAVGSGDAVCRGFGPELARLARSGPDEVALAAVHALGRINPDPDVALPVLQELLQHAEEPRRIAAARALTDLVAVVASLALREKEPTDVRLTPPEALRVIGTLLPVAGRAVRDGQPVVRQLGLTTLRDACVTLRGLLLGDSASADSAAVERAVRELQSQGAVLIHALGDPNEEVRLLAREALVETANLRLRVVECTPGGGSLPAALTAMLLPVAELLTDAELATRLAATEVLETLGPEAAPAVPALVQAASDPNRFVRWATARALGGIGPMAGPAAVDALARLLTDGDLDVCLASARALEGYDGYAAGAVPALVRAAAPGHAVETRVAALRVLRRIDPSSAGAAISELCRALADPDARVRQAAARVLGVLGPVPQPVIDALNRARSDPDPEVQKAAGEALRHVVHP